MTQVATATAWCVHPALGLKSLRVSDGYTYNKIAAHDLSYRANGKMEKDVFKDCLTTDTVLKSVLEDLKYIDSESPEGLERITALKKLISLADGAAFIFLMLDETGPNY